MVAKMFRDEAALQLWRKIVPGWERNSHRRRCRLDAEGLHDAREVRDAEQAETGMFVRRSTTS